MLVFVFVMIVIVVIASNYGMMVLRIRSIRISAGAECEYYSMYYSTSNKYEEAWERSKRPAPPWLVRTTTTPDRRQRAARQPPARAHPHFFKVKGGAMMHHTVQYLLRSSARVYCSY